MTFDAIDVTRLLIASIQFLIGGVALFAFVRLRRLHRTDRNGLVKLASQSALALAIYFLWGVYANIGSTTRFYEMFYVHLFAFAFTRLASALYVLYVVFQATIMVFRYEPDQ